MFLQLKVGEAKKTSFEIDKARELYRPAAARASVLYFILNDLYKINPIYQGPKLYNFGRCNFVVKTLIPVSSNNLENLLFLGPLQKVDLPQVKVKYLIK